MTYCVGWKTGETVILAADTALTSIKPLPSFLTQTSFGERHVSFDDSKFVEERALKLFRLGSFILTYTGSSSMAYALVKTLHSEITKGTSPREALKISIGVNVGSYDKIALICSFYENGRPILLSFNADRKSGQIKEHDFLVQLGSMPDQAKRITADYLNQHTEFNDTSPTRVVKLLSLLQSYGRHNTILRYGVGGAFCALYLDTGGSHWQPDILYNIENRQKEKNKLVSTCVREDCFFINSPILGVKKCFLNVVDDDIKSIDVKARYERASLQAKIQHERGKFSYVIFLNENLPNVIILEMNKKLKHDLLWISPVFDKNMTGLQLLIHPYLCQLRNNLSVDENGNTNSIINFFPYILPSENSPIKKRFKKKGYILKSAHGGRLQYTDGHLI